jgi:hypothetical protein
MVAPLMTELIAVALSVEGPDRCSGSLAVGELAQPKLVRPSDGGAVPILLEDVPE